tara:strand:- start:4213 stop:4848 length:636 start_codon:yes stop_codon:yes gene_type:complete
MAVPGSGTISLWGLAKEKTNDNYSDGISIGTWRSNNESNVSLTRITTGVIGVFDTTNNTSVLKPNNSVPHAMSEWYGYDHDTPPLNACQYTGTMYAIPILGSPTSSAYTHDQSYKAISVGYQQRYNHSSWSTAYIHQCAGSNFTIGNNIYSTNSKKGSLVKYYKTGWRAYGLPGKNWSPGNAPSSNNINAVYDSGAETYNIERVVWYGIDQ